jgi:hypothetical protein
MKRQVVIVNRRGHGRIVPLIEFMFMAPLLKNFRKQLLAEDYHDTNNNIKGVQKIRAPFKYYPTGPITYQKRECLAFKNFCVEHK